MPEPWLRGIRLAVDPVVEPVLFALQQVREDLPHFTDGLTEEQIWRELPGLPALGFHLKHIAGSLDRLTTYLEGSQLNEAQLAALGQEGAPGPALDVLLSAVAASLSRTESVVAKLDPGKYHDPRYVGRQLIPTTVIGLAIHIAEHTQRHCGQAITTAKLILALN